MAKPSSSCAAGRRHPARGAGAAVALLLLTCLTGCPPPTERVPLDPIAMERAIGIVNANADRLTTCLKAEGDAACRFRTPDGKHYQSDLRGVLVVIPPRHLYGTLQSGLGTREILLGSDDEQYWLHVERDDDTLRYGHYSALEDEPVSSLPLRPDQVIEALGLNPLPVDTRGHLGPVQRIADAHQQLLFLTYDPTGQGIIRKEYWLDRHEPRLVRRILFRDALGRVAMDSLLDDHRRPEEGAPMLPHRVRIAWPLEEATLDFRIRTWNPMPDRTTDHPAFVPPHERDPGAFRNIIDLDQ